MLWILYRLIFLNLKFCSDVDDDSFRYLARANMKSEWIWKVFFKYVIPGFLVGSLTTSIVSILFSLYKNGHFDREFVYLPEKFMYVRNSIFIHAIKKSSIQIIIITYMHFSVLDSLPWNQETFFGYFAEMIFYNYTCVAFYIACVMLLFPFVSFCWHHKDFYKMFRHLLQKMDGPDSDEEPNNNELLVKIIRLHTSVRM